MLRCLIASILVLLFALPVVAADYVIGQGDVLEISVWGVEEMSRTVTVRPDGKVTLPAVGDIVADGTTPDQLSDNLAEKMKTFIKQPIVTVSVQQIHNNRVYVTGGALARVVNMTSKTTLLRLLSELGDFSNVDLRRAYLSRNGKKIKQGFFELYFEGDQSQDVELQADDILFIPSNINNLVYVLGAVTAPQPIRYVEGMKVLDAVLAAGGFTEFAKENSVTVVRKDKKKINVDLKKVKQGKDIEQNIAVLPGDYVLVDESLF